MKNLVLLVMFLLGLGLINSSNAQIDFRKVAIQLDLLNGPVYQVTHGMMAGVNSCASLGPDGLLLVDGGHGPLSQLILDQMELWVEKPDPKFVINTHWHGDHTGANEYFGDKAVVISHENVRKRLASQPVLELRDGTTLLDEVGLPKITYLDQLSVYFNGEKIEVFHTPNSHTDGDSIIYFTKSNVACLGDLFQNSAFPMVDDDTGGDLDNYLKTVKELGERFNEDTIMIPGHGQKASLAEFRLWHDDIVESIQFIEQAMKEGQSVDQIIEAGLPEKFDRYHTRPRFISAQNWIKRVFDHLTKKQ